ncbi:hypothetical protein [Oricola thermophila]|uniref:Uncharacterized protein n=1 Tax=Oricola thermophila TaxID=2742145 RepID=A0A6N1VKI5_9HYPH|nr:hypothetical protein [Oricola thermophila]QKV20275.1 hypothetical protein HTY61_18355 [Oricola thermophila]
MKPRGPVTIEEIDEALADLAALMRAHGEQGMEYLPIFERLERERERLVDVDARIDAALARRSSRRRSPPSPCRVTV